MRYLLSLLFALFVLASCEVKVDTGKDEKQEKPVQKRSRIRNNIVIQTTGGVTVEQAFLTYEDDGSFVSDSNMTTINKPVKLNMVVKGWKAKEDAVFLDASQTITTSDGDLVLDKKGMLDHLGALSPKDAEYLRFQFVITRLYKLFDYFQVEVVARNKQADQQVKASFQMHVE
jgi:hypothetical protein